MSNEHVDEGYTEEEIVDKPDKDKEQMVQHLKLIHAMVSKIETKQDLQEQLLANMVTGYIDLSALVEALIACVSDEDAEKFALAFAESKKKILDTMSIGQSHAQDHTDQFVSSDPETIG